MGEEAGHLNAGTFIAADIPLLSRAMRFYAKHSSDPFSRKLRGRKMLAETREELRTLLSDCEECFPAEHEHVWLTQAMRRVELTQQYIDIVVEECSRDSSDAKQQWMDSWRQCEEY